MNLIDKHDFETEWLARQNMVAEQSPIESNAPNYYSYPRDSKERYDTLKHFQVIAIYGAQHIFVA